MSWMCAVRTGGIGHDRGVVLERIADVAVLIGVRADGAVVELIGIGHVVVPLIAVVLPGNVVREHVVADAGHGGRRNGEDGVVGAGVGIGVVAVAEVAGVVVVQQVVVAGFAARRRWAARARRGSSRSAATPGWVVIGAVGVGAAAVGGRAVGAAAVAIFRVPVVGASGRDWGSRLRRRCRRSAFRLRTSTLCGGTCAWPLPSLNQIVSPWPNMMWLAPVPPLTD